MNQSATEQSSKVSYPWYRVVSADEPLEQGDILPNCPIFLIPSEAGRAERIEVTRATSRLIVMSQSCDLLPRGDGRPAIDEVVLCPVLTRAELIDSDPAWKKENQWKQAKDGKLVRRHLLNSSSEANHALDLSVVLLDHIFSLGFDLVTAHAAELGSRLRLLPPYREHLSQSFARFFMRVGLPLDVDLDAALSRTAV